MNEGNRFSISGAVSRRSIPDGCLVLFNADFKKERVLNETGSFIWQSLERAQRAEEIASALANEFEVDDAVAQEDVLQYLEFLHNEHFIEKGNSQLVNGPPLPYEAAPLHVDIALTGHCNLACEYCFFADEMESRPDLPREVWLAFFDELERCAVRTVCFSGGEVFMRSDLFELIDGAIEKRLRFSILSNGGLIDEETITQLCYHKRQRRLDSIQISLDGSCSEIHDRLRGKGSFDGALRAIRLLQEAKLPVTSRVTIHRHNLEDLPAITRLLLDDLKLPVFSTNEAASLGSCRKDDDIKLTTVQRLRAMELLVGLSRQHKGRVTAQGGPLALYRIFKEMEAARNGQIEPTQMMGRLSGCGCPNSRLSVNHDGTITPCTLLSKELMGEIEKVDLSQLWLQSKERKKLLARAKVRQKDLDYCQGCEWTPFCSGGCPATIYAMCGRLDLPNEIQCYKRFIEAVGFLPEF